MTPVKLERQECIVYSRPCGWLTPVRNFNPGKMAEWKGRKFFKLN